MRRCEIDKLGVDLPCGRKAPHFLKIMSRSLGDRGKFKIWLCEKHHDLIQEKAKVTNYIDVDEGKPLDDEASNRFSAWLSK